MSAVTSEAEGVTCAGHTELRRLDSNFATLNINSGTGMQSNHHQTGTNNTQFNAQTQTFYNTTQPLAEQEKTIGCLDALLTIRPEDHRAGIISTKGKRVTGTCEWVKQDKAYQALLRGETRLLWIQGGPGKGKTMLSIFLTQELQRTHGVIYFFCQADDETHRSATYVLRSIIWQLAVQEPAIAHHLPQYLHPPKEKSHVLGSREALWSIFVKMAEDSKASRTYLLLDGLDECDEDSQRWLAVKLEDLCQARKGPSGISNFRIIVVSRPGIPMPRESRQVMLDPDNSEHVNDDIGVFISSRVQELSIQLGGLSDSSRIEFESRMQSEFLYRAEGTFLWVGFAMIELLKKRTLTQMEDAIRELPKGLSALYDRMLLQIDSRYRSSASKILRWVAFAARPLSIHAISEIIGSKPSGTLSAEQSTLDQLTICGPFLTISDRIVSLVHESARDYISLAKTNNAAVLGDSHLQPCAVHLEMAAFCLARIEQDFGTQARFNQDSIDDVHTDSNSSRYSISSAGAQDFSDYATCNWPEHARLSGNNFERLSAAAPTFFTKTSRLRDRWWTGFCAATTLRLSRRWFDMCDIPALHMACFLGITSWVAKLLKPKLASLLLLWPNRPHGRYGLRPLMYAAIGGHAVVIDQLLRSHAKVGSRDRAKWTALHHAVHYEQAEVTRILLKRGADTDARTKEGDSLFSIAAQGGSDMIMQHLVEHVKSLKPRSNGFRGDLKGEYTPLHIATIHGHVDVMEYLLGEAAEIESKTGCQETPLHLAADSGHVKASRLLLQKGAAVDAQSGLGKTPLHIAAMSFCTNEALLEILLTAGADVNKRLYTGETPLHCAASNPYTTKATVCVLLRAEADVCARTSSGMTPLHAAAQTVHWGEGILESLVQAGAEVDALSNDGHSPLDLALETGLSPTFMLEQLEDSRNACVLIAHGASVNIADNTILLHKAASVGDEQLIEVLLDHGFRSMINIQDSAGVTPLHRAIIGSDTMRDIEDGGSLASMELYVFERHHPASIVRLLLENGADVEAADQHGDTPLHYATKCGRKEIVLMLLEFEADVTVKARNGKTVLQMARATGNDDLVQILVEHGARDVD